MSEFFVYDVFANDKICIIDEVTSAYSVGTIDINGETIYFYSDTNINGGGHFGNKLLEGMLYLIRTVKEDERQKVIILFLNSVGADLLEYTHALDCYATLFKEIVELSKNHLLISVISGNCVGGSAYLASLSDAILFSVTKGNLCITGPRIVESVLGEKSNKSQLGGFETQSASGTVTMGFSDEEECKNQLEFLVSTQGDADYISKDAIRKLDDSEAIFDNKPYDVMRIIEGLIDQDSGTVAYKMFAPNILTLFGRMGGKSIGILANQPLYSYGAIDSEGAEKARNFLRLCGKLRLPLLVIADVPSFMPGVKQELKGIQWKGADFLREMISLDVKKVTLILHKSYGGAYIAMNSICLGATEVYAWPNAEIGIMGVRAEYEIKKDSSSDYENKLSAEYNLSGKSITDIIQPSITRERLIEIFKNG